ncbi:MAG: T9SS type A sorting domain-containing protein [Bacteroidota bacterium]
MKTTITSLVPRTIKHYFGKVSLWFKIGCVLLVLLLTINANSQTHTWTGASSSLWNVPLNWSPIGTPGMNDQVIIEDISIHAPILTNVVAVVSVTIKDGATLTIQSTATLDIDNSPADGLVVEGNATLYNYGEITIGQTSGIVNSGIENDGTIYNDGGLIQIDNTAIGIENDGNSEFYNENGGQVLIGETGVLTGNAIENKDAGKLVNQVYSIVHIFSDNNILDAANDFSNFGTIVDEASGDSDINYNGPCGVIQNLSGGSFSITNNEGVNTNLGGVIWTGCTGANWNNDDNWHYLQKPTATDNVRIFNVSTSNPRIGSSASVVAKSVLLANGGELTILSGGTLTIEGSSNNADGIYNLGTVENSGTINIGSNASIGQNGIDNRSVFNNKSSGEININDTGDDGINNHSGTFTNEGTIKIGNNTSISGYGLINKSTFNNAASGSLRIGDTASDGLYNESSTFANEGELRIGQGGSPADYGIVNDAVFQNNAGAVLEINNLSSFNVIGFENSSGTFTNSGTVNIGNSSSVDGQAINNQATFNNLSGGLIDIREVWSGIINDAGSIENSGTIEIGQSINLSGDAINNNAAFDNSSCGATIHVYNGSIVDNSSMTNDGTIIQEDNGNHNIDINNSLILNIGGGNFTVGSGNDPYATALGNDEIIWTGCSNNDWNNSDNWYPNNTPKASDSVKIIEMINAPTIMNGTNALAHSILLEENVTMTISSGATLSIDGTAQYGMENKGTVDNYGTITIIGDSDHGVFNEGTINNQSGGILDVDESDGNAFINEGTVDNAGQVLIGQTSGNRPNNGLNNRATFNNLSGGIIRIDYISSDGLKNIESNSVFTNEGTIHIGQSGTIGANGLENQNTFNNNGGTITIDNTVYDGIVNYQQAQFSNTAGSDIQIGLNGGNIGDEAIFNFGTGTNFTNDGLLQIDNTDEDAIDADDGSVITNNSTGSILIGQSNGNIGRTGIYLFLSGSTLSNNGGLIKIDGTGKVYPSNGEGLVLHAGTQLTNSGSGEILIGQNSGGIGKDGLHIAGGKFDNEDNASLRIDQTSEDALHISNSGSLKNMGNASIVIGEIGNIVAEGLYLENGANSFSNLDCATFVLFDAVNNEEAITNEGLFRIDTDQAHANSGSFINEGIMEIIQLPEVPNVTNDEIIIAPFSGCAEASDALQLGGTVDYTVGTQWFTDAVMTNVAGTYDQGTNTYSVINLSLGTHTLYFSITGNGCSFDVSVEFEYSEEGTRTWTGAVSTDWTEDGNWSPACTPNALNDVEIPNVTNSPVIMGGTNAEAKTITVANNGLLTINNGGVLNIDATNNSAELTNNGSVENSGVIHVGATNANSGNDGIKNFSAFNNHATGIVNVYYSNSVGLRNSGGTFTNMGTLNIGLNGATASASIRNESSGTFINSSGGTINADNTTEAGIANFTSGTFTNEGAINIGQNGFSSVDEEGILNFAYFTNALNGVIKIDHTESAGIIVSSNGLFSNLGDIYLGQIGTIGTDGIENTNFFANAGNIVIQNMESTGINNSGDFQNNTCGDIYSEGSLLNSNSFNNTGLVTFNTTSPHTNSGIFTNDGVLELILSNEIPNVSNSEIIILPFSGCSNAMNALDLGGAGNYTVGTQWYTDAAMTNLAGTYDQGTNTFTVTNLTGGTHSLYFTVSGNGCNYEVSVEFDYEADGTRTWTGAISTDWDDPANWSPTCKPNASNDVNIPVTANSPIILNGINALAKLLVVQSGAHLTIDDGGTLQIENSNYTGLVNYGDIDNSGSILIGQTSTIGSFGIWNDGTFNSTSTGIVLIDNTQSNGFDNSGNVTNEGNINIGQNSGAANIGGHGMVLSPNANFYNQGDATLTVDNASLNGIELEGSCLLENSGDATITIGENGGFGWDGLYLPENTSSFSNLDCAAIYLLENLANSGTITNESLFQINTDQNHGNDGTFINNGVLEIVQLPAVANIINYEVIIAPFYSCKITTQFALQLGGSGQYTVGSQWFSDAAMTNVAGNYDQGANTFTVTNLSNGTHTLYFNVTGNGCSFDVYVEIEYEGGGIRTWTGAIDNTWEEDGNWSPACVPSAVHDVLIPAATNSPVIANGESVQVKSVEVASGGQLIIDFGGALNIDNATADGLMNDGTIDIAGSVQIGQTGTIGDEGIENDGTINIEVDGTVFIDNTQGFGLDNDGEFTNGGTLNIGQIGGANNIQGNSGLLNLANFNNIGNGVINIDNTQQVGLSVTNGTFTNESIINIGQSGSIGNIGSYGLVNVDPTISSFHNLGTINIDNTGNDGLFYEHDGPTFINDGVINIGQNGSAANINGDGIYSAAVNTFSNGGTINIDNTTDHGFYTTTDVLNTGNILIGQNGGTSNIGGHGLMIGTAVQFDNDGNAIIKIDETGQNGIEIESSGHLENSDEAVITIGENGNIGAEGLSLKNGNSSFFNLDCAAVQLFDNLNFEGTITNEALFQINTDQAHTNTGTFTNDGIMEIIQFPEVPSVTNNGIIIVPFAGGGSVTDVLQLGSGINNYIINVDWFIDIAMTNEAGNYAQPTNIFTVSNLSEGTHTLYFDITGSGCSFDVSVEFDYEEENLWIWTGAVNTDWNESGNWAPAIVPVDSSNVEIPETANHPVIFNGTDAYAKKIIVESNASLTINNGAILNIDDSAVPPQTASGALTNDGTVNNHGQLLIGQTEGSDGAGLANRGQFNNLNGGVIEIDNAQGGLQNILGGQFENAAGSEIRIGSNDGNIDDEGIFMRTSEFTNSGIIQMDNIADFAMAITKFSEFTNGNDGEILIGQNGGNVLATGLTVSQSEFYNIDNGIIKIDQTGNSALHLNVNGEIENDGNAEIIIGAIGGISENGIDMVDASSSLSNLGCASIQVYDNLNNAGTITNEGLFTIDTDQTHTNSGTFDNSGVIETIQSPEVPNVNNTEIIISPFSGCNNATDALQLGSAGNYTVGTQWFTDVAMTNVAGTYDQSTNIFTVTNLSEGIHTLYFSLTGNGCSFDVSVEFEYEEGAGTRTWTGLVNTDWEEDFNWSPACSPSSSNEVIIPDVTNEPVIANSMVVSVKSIAVQSGGYLHINAGGTLNIDDSSSDALMNEGSIENFGTIQIGQSFAIGNQGIYNTGVFNNGVGGVITIDNTDSDGLFNESSGNFINSGNLDIGQNGGNNNIGFIGFDNRGSFENTVGGVIQVDYTSEDGFRSWGPLENAGTIIIGSAGSTSNNFGLSLETETFYNLNGGTIEIDNTDEGGVRIGSNGTLNNAGLLKIGQSGGPENIKTFGIITTGSGNLINTEDGIIQIDNTRAMGIANIAGSVTNEGAINIGLNGGANNVDDVGIQNRSDFTNQGNGEINIMNVADEGIVNMNDGNLSNESGATITSSSSIVMDGTSFTNNGSITTDEGLLNLSGSMDGNGSFTFATEWVNNAIFDFTGTVTINGNTTTEFIGNSLTTFYDLTIDKTAASVRLEQAIQIDGNLQMTSGNLDLNGYDLTLGTDGTIIDESASSYIFGTVGGEIIKTITLDQPQDENPGNIGVQITSLANLGSTTIKRGHVPYTVNGNVAILRYYDISPTNNSGLDATVRFFYLDAELNGNLESALSPYRFDGSSWEEYVVSSSDLVENYVETANVDAFSTWTLGSASQLPVELVHFTASINKEDLVELNWQTASEINNDYFVVERSRNGLQFEEIERVIGAGNFVGVMDYLSFDENPLAGTAYYRLRQVDFDGRFSYSPIRSVQFTEEDQIISIFPNPVSTVTNIQLPGNFGIGSLQVTDLSGKVLLQSSLDEEVPVQQLDVSLWQAGLYIIHLEINGKVFTEKMIVTKD